MAETNPRFPHWCRIIRKTADNPLDNEGGFSLVEKDYDPMEGNGDEMSGGENSVVIRVIYQGKCRSYEKNTTSDKGEAITSLRGLSLPLMQDDWSRLGAAPQEGDEVVVCHGVYREYGRIIDKNPTTASFSGTHIIWRYVRS